MIPLNEWEFCFHCGYPVVTCKACHNSSCNGGGCGRCRRKFGLAHAQASAKAVPATMAELFYLAICAEAVRAHPYDRSHWFRVEEALAYNGYRGEGAPWRQWGER